MSSGRSLSLPLPLLVAEVLHSGAKSTTGVLLFPPLLSLLAYEPAHELFLVIPTMAIYCPYTAVVTAAPACAQWSRTELHIDSTTAGRIDQSYYSNVHRDCSQLATEVPGNIYLPYGGVYTFWLHFTLTALG